MNTFGFFIEKGVKILDENGRLGFIIPNTILTQEYYQQLRRFILDKTNINKIATYKNLVFDDAVVETVTLILSLNTDIKNTEVQYFDDQELINTKKINQIEFNDTHKNQFSVSFNDEEDSIKKQINLKIKTKFKDFVEINQAIALKSDRAAYLFNEKIAENYKPVIDGREIGRYNLNWKGSFLKYEIEAIHSCKREDIFLTSEKIFFRRVSANIIATLDTNQFYALNTLIAVNLKPTTNESIKFILGLLN